MQNILFVASDPGAYNPFSILHNYSLEHKVFKSCLIKDRVYLEHNILKADYILIGTSMDMELELEALKLAKKFQKPCSLFIDEIYNIENRLNSINDVGVNPDIIFLQKKINLEEYQIRSSLRIFGNPSLDISVINQKKFNYKFSESGPIVIIDEYKSSFELEGVTKRHNSIFFSDLVKKYLDSSNYNFEVRGHPKYLSENLKFNYVSGPVSLFIGYSSIALAELALQGFPCTSLADKQITSLSLSFIKRSTVGKVIRNTIDSRGLKVFKDFHNKSAQRILDEIKSITNI